MKKLILYILCSVYAVTVHAQSIYTTKNNEDTAISPDCHQNVMAHTAPDVAYQGNVTADGWALPPVEPDMTTPSVTDPDIAMDLRIPPGAIAAPQFGKFLGDSAISVGGYTLSGGKENLHILGQGVPTQTDTHCTENLPIE